MERFNESIRIQKKLRIAEYGFIGATAHWCECLQGSAPLKPALAKIAECMDAEAVALTRVSRTPEQGTRSLIFDQQASRDGGWVLERSFARSVLGPYINSAESGSIWLCSKVDSDSDPALVEFWRRRHLKELVVIPLAAQKTAVDFIEIHFSEQPGAEMHAMLNMLGATLVQTWANRAPGLFADSFLYRSNKPQPIPTGAPILSTRNPSRLSRAEFRICVLLSQGLTNSRIGEVLGICNSTLRTHLRNVFAKTNTTRQSELVFQLLTAGPIEKAGRNESNVA